MTSGSYVEHRLALLENRSDHGHVWQVSPSCQWMVAQNHISFLPRISEASDLKANCLLHGSQVYRQVWSIGNQIPVMVEQCARKVEPLLNIDARRSPLESDSHLLSNRHEPMTEYGQFDRIQRYFLYGLVHFRLMETAVLQMIDFDVSKLIDECLPKWLDQDCARLVENYSRATYPHLCLELLQVIDLRLQLLALSIHLKPHLHGRSTLRTLLTFCLFDSLLLHEFYVSNSTHPHIIDYDPSFFKVEAKFSLMLCFKGFLVVARPIVGLGG